MHSICGFYRSYSRIPLRELWECQGGIHTGIADYYSADYCLHEYGEDEDGVIIEEFLVYASQIDSIEEIEVHGTAELRTERLV